MTRTITDILKDDGLSGVLRCDVNDYRAIPRMNASSIKPGLIGTTEVDANLIRAAFEGTSAEPSSTLQDSFDRGSLAHCILFEPDWLLTRFAVWTGKKRGGQDWNEFTAENTGKTIMRDCDVRAVQHACREFRKVPEIGEILKRKHDTELSVVGQVGRTFCKGTLDFITTDSGPVTLVDLKTTRTGIDEASVLRTVRSLKYREQLAFYAQLYKQATGREVAATYLLFVSLDDVGVRLVKLTTSALQFGFSRMVQAIEAVEKCIDSDSWPTFFGQSVCDVSEYEIGEIPLEGFDE